MTQLTNHQHTNLCDFVLVAHFNFKMQYFCLGVHYVHTNIKESQLQRTMSAWCKKPVQQWYMYTYNIILFNNN
jgi:hypothetical protein